MELAADLKPQSRRWVALLIVVAATVPFLPGATAPFSEWDDPYYVFRSKRLTVAGWEGLSDLWVFENALRDEQIEFFPLRDSIYWVLWQGFGANPTPYHLANIAFHVLASLLVALVARRLGFSRWVALIAGLIFATHPVHTESVVWVSGLKDPMFLSAMLGSLACYLGYRETQKPALYAGALLLLAAALMCKSLALSTVFLFIASERLIGAPTRWRLIAMRVAGPLVLTAMSLVHIVAIGRATNIVSGPHGGNWGSHWILMAWAMVRYLQQAVLPASFRMYYCFAPAQGMADPRLWISVLVLLAVVAVGVVFYRRDRRLAFLLLWFFICLGPVANIIPFPALMADRYLYSPTVAVAMLVALGLSRLRQSRGLAVLVVLTLGLVTAGRAWAWQRVEELWDEVAEDTACWQDTSPLAVNALLQWALSQTDPEKAIEAFRSVARHPTHQRSLGDFTCDRFLRSTIKKTLDDEKLELRAAEVMAYFCPKYVNAWERLALAAWHRRPDIAARAMENAYLDSPLTFRRWRLGLARFNANDPRAHSDIENALTREPGAVCVSFSKWLATLPEARRAEYSDLIKLCPAN
jgi:hypothetical protein